MEIFSRFFGVAVWSVATAVASVASFAAEPVTVETFVRAETDRTMAAYVEQAGGVGKFFHIRQPTPLDQQNVIRMNLDTLYSVGVFDLTTPVKVNVPEGDGRFLSVLMINQDHSMQPVQYAPTEVTMTQEMMGTRYGIILLRSFVDSTNPDDIATANKMQDAVEVTQEDPGTFEVPEWDCEQLETVRNAINVLASTKTDTSGFFGNKEELNPIDHLMGAAFGWGGNPKEAAVYLSGIVEQNDGKTPHVLTITEEVPVEEGGFVSLTFYNAEGFMEPNDLGVNAVNNVTAVRNDDGSVDIQAGSCGDSAANCVPITDGWNYIVRLYRPSEAIISGEYQFPEFEPLQ